MALGKSLPKVVAFLAAAVNLAFAQPIATFGPTGHLTTERAFHTATLLTNGKVLVAGGWATLAGWPVWASAELYDPSARTFSATGSMTTPRVGHTSTLLPDGRVLVAGGDTIVGGWGNSAQAAAELYDPSTGTFQPTASMNSPRTFHTATLLNTGNVLITGGFTYDNGRQTSQASAELYDPLTSTFKPTGSMITARAWHTATLLPSGKVLIDGGDTNTAELYDPATGTFSSTGVTPFADVETTTVLANGKVLSTIGDLGDFDNQAALYDPLNGTFTPTAKMTVSRGYTTATLLPAGSVLIYGRDEMHDGGSAEVYDPVTATFNPANGLFPESEEGHTATLLPDGTVLLAGGWICCGFSVANAVIYVPAMLTPSPVLFTLSDGVQGAVWHATTGVIATAANPASAGEALSMYTKNLIDGGAIPPRVVVGGKLAEILYFGDAPGYPGYFQVNFRVPDGVPSESAVSVRLIYLNRPSNAVAIGVR